MRTMKCPNCGGNFVPQPEGYYVCDHCGAISEGAGSDLKEEDVINLDNANYRRDQYEFDEALSLCRKVLQRNPLNAEANRCAILAIYRIVYLKNAKGEYTATFPDPETESPITQSPYYRNLPERSKRELDKVEAIRQHVLRNAKNIPQYDVFISYKSGVEEAEWAKECYKILAKQQDGKRYNVFYDEVSLGAKQAGWEPHIYAALKSAKCMILFASSLDNINSVWVQNEWKRFIYLQKSDPQKEIIVVGKNINPYDLPDPAMREEQMLTVGIDPWQNHVKSRVREICDDSNISELLKNGDSYLLVGKFKKAKTVFRRILGLDPKCAEAYWGLLRCRLKAFDDYDIVKCRKRLDKIDEFYKARTLAETENDVALIKRIRKVQNAQIAKDVSAFDRNNYDNYRKRTKKLRIFKKVSAVFCALAIVAAGMFGYWECLHPLKYSVENDQATLKGKSFFFRFVTPEELNVEKYNEYPIVAIGDAALSNGKFKTAKLASFVKTIGDSAFAGSKNLTKVTCLSATVTIGDSAFANCTALSEIEFGESSSETALAAKVYNIGGAVSIGERAFENCVSLESITLTGLTDLGANAFSGCTNLKEVYIDSGKDLNIGMGAFDNVSDTLVVHIPTVEEDLYNSLAREYSNIMFETYTRDPIEEVCYFIDKIGEISLDSLSAIERAEQLYSALSPEERGQVTNYGDLRDARAIYAAVAAIDHIGTVTLQNEADIKVAENAFNALNESQKEKVSNREALTDARAVFNTMKRISEIGSVSLQSKSAIESAEAAYGALTEKQKGMVSNYAVLRDARDVYDVSVAIDLINRIGSVSESSGSLIRQAEQAYNALSPALRTRVTNYTLLQEARLVYNAIVAIAKINVITADSAADISAAENLYYALTEEQQGKVTNRTALESARKIYAVVEIIEGIGQISLGNESAIIQAERAFKALSEAEQKRVGNQSELADARAAYDVMEMIAAVGSATAGNRAQIEAAKNAYDALTAAQRKKVTNYNVLQTAIDDLRAFDVEQLIGKIGQVTLSSAEKIEAAETAYQALTSAQKERVSNYSVLLDARHIYDLLVVICDLGSVTVGKGKQYSYDTLTSSSVSKLNQSTYRDSIESLTFTGIKKIQESLWTAAFSKLALVRYDLTSASAPSSFTVPSGDLTYVLVGATSKKYTMKINAQAGASVHVGFDNFALEHGTLPIDLTDANEAYISFYGNCSITATAGGAGAIKTKECTITLEKAAVTVKAADGAVGVAGGNGLETLNLIIESDASSKLTIQGGNGVDGVAGKDGTKGADGGDERGAIRNNLESDRISRAGKNGTNGADGTNGTNGGNAAVLSSLQINSGTIDFIGGRGGNGGDGGCGGNGGNGYHGTYIPLTAYFFAGNGGKGGNGGNGGCGGRGGSAVEINDLTKGKILIDGGNITFHIEKCGNGGNGGNGGDGGNGGADDWYELHGGSNGGQGGDGGKGGSSYTAQSQTDISSRLTNNGGIINYVTSGKSASVGEGGGAGTGGAYGENHNGFGGNGHGDAGDPGKRGDNGDMLSR